MIDFVKYVRKMDKPDKPYNFVDFYNSIYNDRLTRLLSMFVWKGLPENIPYKILELQLMTCGSTVFLKHGESYYISEGEIGGELNYLYLPKNVIISNPYIGNDGLFKKFNVSEDCVLIKNDTLMRGVSDTLDKSTYIATHIKLSVKVALINLRIVSLLKAMDDNTKNAMLEYMKKVEGGEISVITDSLFEEFESIKTTPFLQGNYYDSLKVLLEYEQYNKAQFFNDFGLNANWNAKREAIGDGESSLNDDALLPLIDDMLYCREQACEQINKMYNLNVSVEYDSSWKDNVEQLQAEQDILENSVPSTQEGEGGENDNEEEN